MKTPTPTPTPFPIDIVVAWCSGPPSDALLKQYTRGKKEPYVCTASDDLRYCLRSIAVNVSWYRRLVLVIADHEQLPVWMNPRRHRLRIVRHSEFIPETPTFNSNVIESFVDQIPGLANHFVYFNDDTYVVQSVAWTRFFTSDGRPINRHMPGPGYVAVPVQAQANLYTRNWTWLSQRYKLTDYRLQHQAMPYTRSIIRKYREHIGPIRLHRFRRLTDINVLRVTGAMASQYGDAVRLATDENTETFIEAADVSRLKPPLGAMVAFLCINNAVIGDTHVYVVLDRILPRPSPWERSRKK